MVRNSKWVLRVNSLRYSQYSWKHESNTGSAAHINLQDHLSKEQYLKLIDFAIKEGTNYFTFNIPNTKCNKCGHIVKQPFTICPKCNSEDVTQYTRIIGYMRPISAFAEDRKIEAGMRTYSKEV